MRQIEMQLDLWPDAPMQHVQRITTAKQIEACVRISAEHAKVSPNYQRLTLDAAAINDLVKAIVAETNYCGYILTDMTAFIVGYVCPLPFAHELIAYPLLLLKQIGTNVQPSKLRLLNDAFVKWAVGKGAVEVRVGQSSGLMDNRRAAILFNRVLGYQPLGTTYHKAV